MSPNCLFDGNGGGRLRSRIQRFAFPLVNWWDQVTHKGATVFSFFFFLCGKYHYIYYSLIFSGCKRIWYYSYFYYLLFYSCSIAIRAVCSFLFEVLRGSFSCVILILEWRYSKLFRIWLKCFFWQHKRIVRLWQCKLYIAAMIVFGSHLYSVSICSITTRLRNTLECDVITESCVCAVKSARLFMEGVVLPGF